LIVFYLKKNFAVRSSTSVMRKISLVLFLSVCLYLDLPAQYSYYVDTAGIDEAYGLTNEEAWKSLEKLNAKTFQAGDSILFKRGGIWTGSLRPGGSGSENKRIVIGSYGDGPAPVINAEGMKEPDDLMSASILLYNQEYWEIRDIEVRNFEQGDPEYPCKKAGILVLAKDIGTLHDFRFVNLKICDVNGSLKTRYNGGLFLNIIADTIPEKRIPTNFDGIYVNGCHFQDVNRGGFLNQSFWRRRDLHSNTNWFPSYNILIEHSKFVNIGGNGLVTRVTESPVVQYNLFIRNSLLTTGNASYPYNCNNALWQYNEACYTVYNEGDVDASGFDSDYKCKNTVIQYNYSHHNDWGSLLVCSWGAIKGSFNDGTIVRYNVFQDDKHHLIRFSGNITNTTITKNLFISDYEIDDVMLWYKEWGEIWPDQTVLSGNVFYNEGAKQFLKLGKTSNNNISENTLHGDDFLDYNDFDSISGDKNIDSIVRKIRVVGQRENTRVSQAEKAVRYMFGEKLGKDMMQ